MAENDNELLDDELDQDEVLDEDEDESTDDATDGADDDESEDEADKAKSMSKEEKRIRALQSQLDKAVAENNKLKKAGTQPKAGSKARDPEVESLLQFALDQTRDSLYAAEPRLKEYGIGAEMIGGATRDEMQTSLKSLKRLISRVETGARNKALREHGFSPAPNDAGAEKPRNFSAMTGEEFDRLVKETAGN